MPRAKKELKDQLLADEMERSEGTALEDTGLPPDSGSDREIQTAGSLSDLELSHTGTLDPDALQTPFEEGDTADISSQTDSEPPLESERGSEDGLFPQTGAGPELDGMDALQASSDEFADGRPPDASMAELFGDGGIFGSEEVPGAQAPPFYLPQQQTGSEDTAPAAGSVPGQADGMSQDEPANGPAQTDGARPRLRMPRRRGPRVVSIDAERTVETENDRLRSDLLDLVESFKGKKILTGTIQGVERLASNPEMCYAVTYHGDFKIIIPVLDAIEEPEDYRDQSKGDVLHYLLNKRLGAEVDYIVKRIDQEGGVVAASRLEAMAMKRREYYFRTDRDGNYQIYEGIRAEARVVSVIRAGIFVDLFGVECYIPLRELSYQRWMDAASHYQPGQRVLVKVLEVDRSDRDKPAVTASVKQASENPYEKALKKYAVGNRYVGTVSMVDLSGVFVSLDGGIDCLCTHPKRGRPPRGARVTVRILGINNETNRIWGVITHMSTTR